MCGKLANAKFYIKLQQTFNDIYLMAPVPEDNKEKIPDEDEIDMFSNPNLSVTQISDSSDENDDDYSNINDLAGYTLLSQEPNEGEGDCDDYDDEDNTFNTEGERDSTGESNSNTEKKDPVSSSANNELCNNERTDPLSDTIYQPATGATAPKVTCHPAFLTKFPDGKMPSYLQVPPLPPDMKEQLWNQKRQEKNSISLDSGQESSILKAMAGFSLPQEHIPDWARDMSDDQWKQEVVEKIKPKEKQTKLPSKLNSQSPQQLTADNKSDAGGDWIATFPDS